MGYYINPENMTKEEWIAKHGVLLTSFYKRQLNKMPVCLVDNGPFKALAIAYNETELKEFLRPDDKRKKVWYLVDVKHLLPYLPEHMRLITNPRGGSVSRPGKVNKEFVQEYPIELIQSSSPMHKLYLAAKFEVALVEVPELRGLVQPDELTQRVLSIIDAVLQIKPVKTGSQVQATNKMHRGRGGITIQGEHNLENNTIRIWVRIEQ